MIRRRLLLRFRFHFRYSIDDMFVFMVALELSRSRSRQPRHLAAEAVLALCVRVPKLKNVRNDHRWWWFLLLLIGKKRLFRIGRRRLSGGVGARG